VVRVYDEAGNVIETHEHTGRVQGTMNGLAILQSFSGHFPLWSKARSSNFGALGALGWAKVEFGISPPF
jgi:hypothetical protein